MLLIYVLDSISADLMFGLFGSRLSSARRGRVRLLNTIPKFMVTIQ